MFPEGSCQCKWLWTATVLHLQLFPLCLTTPNISKRLQIQIYPPAFAFFSNLSHFFTHSSTSFQKNSKAALTEIYRHVWCCFIRWWLILQRRRWTESLWAKVLKSCAGGQRKALAWFCHRLFVDAAVRSAGGPQWGRCGRGVALTQQSIQEVITWTCLQVQGL